MTTITPTAMTNRQLIESLVRAARNERSATVDLLELLGELDERRLYLSEGCSSLFTYCTQVLHLSEHAAYHRIEAARAARRFPVILSLFADGALTLTTVAMLRRHLTPDNHLLLLKAARHKSKREVEEQIGALAPKPRVPTLIRRVPEVKTEPTDLFTPQQSVTVAGGAAVSVAPQPALAKTPFVTAPASTPSPMIAPLGSDRYLLRVTLSVEAHANLRRAQDLMRHTIPSGDAAAVLERALELLVDRLEQAKAAKARRPRTSTSTARTAPAPGDDATASRYIPAPVRREVWARDQGRCAFVGPCGRCTETGRLEYHHLLPFARGGPASVSNIALRCRAHHRFESEAIFGAWITTTTELGPDRVG